MSKAAGIKNVGWGILGLGLMVILATLGMALLTGAAAFSVWVLKWTFPAFSITFAISLVLLLLSLIPQTRGFAAVGLMIASIAFGAILWLWGMSYTYIVWGLFAVFLGLFLLGVGVVPVAMLAALVHGDWGTLVTFVIAVVVTFGSRGLAHWLGDKADERSARLRRSEITVQAYPMPE